MKKNNKKINILVFLGMFLLPLASFAYQIQDLPGAEIKNDFVLGPGKIELFMESGQSVTHELYITNRTGQTMKFKIGLEDFSGSRNPSETVVLLGDEKSPYSLKDYIKPEAEEFVLKSKQRIILPVKISIPLDAEPGGLYGTVLVSTVPAGEKEGIEPEKVKGGAVTITRLGALVFVRVKGDVREDGMLKKFSAEEKKFFKSGPIPFEILFENNGNVHLNPYGIIEIKNIFGARVGEVKVDPWFVMPDSLRLREVKWDRDFLFGYYTAELKINRGYNDIIDEASAGFWVVPWKIVLAGVAVLFIALFLLKWLISNFEIRKKS